MGCTVISKFELSVESNIGRNIEKKLTKGTKCLAKKDILNYAFEKKRNI